MEMDQVVILISEIEEIEEDARIKGYFSTNK